VIGRLSHALLATALHWRQFHADYWRGCFASRTLFYSHVFAVADDLEYCNGIMLKIHKLGIFKARQFFSK
jgi:hypothetical protein